MAMGEEQRAVRRMAAQIAERLEGCRPSIYLYGSAAMGDFRPGWSDLDILVLTRETITPEQAGRLLFLRQEMLEKEPENPDYRFFEGGMLDLCAFLDGHPSRVIYWGTGGQRVTDTYLFDSFCMTELLESGRLRFGPELRGQLRKPSYAELRADVAAHCRTICQYGVRAGRSFRAFGWLLDTARGLCTLKTGRVVSKTAAGEWALENGLCPDRDALETALQVRRDPLLYQNDPSILDCAETLGPKIRRFADILENELRLTGETQDEKEGACNERHSNPEKIGGGIF